MIIATAITTMMIMFVGFRGETWLVRGEPLPDYPERTGFREKVTRGHPLQKLSDNKF